MTQLLLSCLNAYVAIRPGNVESPIGVLIGLSTEVRIDDATAPDADRVSAQPAAPLRDARVRAVPACALIAPAHKGRTARSALILLNARRRPGDK